MAPPNTPGCSIGRLRADDHARLHALLAMFGEAFGDADPYGRARPSPDYVRRLLGGDQCIALAASEGEAVVGGLVAYVLPKFEQERSEVYLYDLAVAASHRRRGIATALVEELKAVARALGAYVVFVQADRGDEAAIALYTRLGTREDVLHFDIALAPRPARR